MEKFVRLVSALITFGLIYIAGAYIYLSSKGFEYTGHGFVLVPAAEASQSNLQGNQLATPIESNVSINFNYPPVLGNENAPLTLYEFSSLGCSHCADFHLNILPRLQKDFIDTGLLKVVFVNFPLDKKSMQGALLFECVEPALRHNYLNTVFSKQREWMFSYKSDTILSSYALANGLNKDKAEECLKDSKMAEEIITNRQEAIEKFNVNGTPAFIISDKDKHEIIYGVPAFEDLVNYLNQRLAQ